MRRSCLLPGMLALSLASAGCTPNPGAPDIGAQLFQSPQVNAIALAGNGRTLLVANTTSHTVSVFRTARLPEQPGAALQWEIPVGVDPVGIAVRPKANLGDPDLALVTNHISDSISVIDYRRGGVVQTLQELDENGVSTTDAPTGVVFAGPNRAFVALDDRDEIVVIDFDGNGNASIHPERLVITAQAPRAMTVLGDRLFVGAFESGNQTEFPNCGPLDTDETRGFSPGDSWDEGCQFYNRFIETLNVDLSSGQLDVDIEFGTIVNFAARNPNLGGEVIIDRDRPDRDVFVFDVNALGAPLQVIDGVSTLLYGMETSGNRIYVTSADGRNDLDGLEDLDNRMFENRLSYMDCTPDCGAPQHMDLDQNPHGVPVPTPYGVRASGNGQALVVSVAGSDGIPGLAEDPTTDIPGLVTLDADGNVLGHVQTGAIPQGVALASDAEGNATIAYVLNAVESTVSVVDVGDLANPTVVGTFDVGDDPTPDEIRQGRTAFMSARSSTKGTFSCESCHPNGNTDQLIWTINTVESPQDLVVETEEGPVGCNPFTDPCPEPRTTMPTPRGLRDTLPLHWLGNLADPFPDQEGQLFQPEDDGAPDCDLETDGEVGCARHLVNASLSGVMCDQAGGCAVGPSGLPGALTDDERNAIAAFMMAVSYPPAPTRRPDDVLSATAVQGVADFFTDEDGLGVGTAASGVGQAVGFAPITCADNSGGCHALPHQADTNSITVGAFEAPTMRGIWDRHVQFSNGSPSAEEVLVAGQICADGDFLGAEHPILGEFLTGDPCALSSPLIEAFLGFSLDPFEGVPSGETIYDPAVGFTERGVFLSTFESLFTLAYGMRGAPMWEFFSEMSVGFHGLYGRQVTIGASEADSPAKAADLAELTGAAEDGRVTLMAHRLGAWGQSREYGYDPEDGLWNVTELTLGQAEEPLTTGALLDTITEDGALTVTAHLKGGISIGGADRQPLLHVDPDEKETEEIGELLAIPRPEPLPDQSFRIGHKYVSESAQIIVDGVTCDACSFTMGSTENGNFLDVTIPQQLTEGTHVMQVRNPDGWVSNEMPMQVEVPPPPFTAVPDETIQCMVDAGCLTAADPIACGAEALCENLPGEVACVPAGGFLDCNSCLLFPDCSDGSCTAVPTAELVPTGPLACAPDFP